jgi:hypothetical protein
MKKQPKRDLDERTKIDLDPEEAMRALLKVDPKSEPVVDDVPDELEDAARQETEYSADETDEG